MGNALQHKELITVLTVEIFQQQDRYGMSSTIVRTI